MSSEDAASSGLRKVHLVGVQHSQGEELFVLSLSRMELHVAIVTECRFHGYFVDVHPYENHVCSDRSKCTKDRIFV